MLHLVSANKNCTGSWHKSEPSSTLPQGDGEPLKGTGSRHKSEPVSPRLSLSRLYLKEGGTPEGHLNHHLLPDGDAQAFMDQAGEEGVLLVSLGTIAELSKCSAQASSVAC